MAGRGPQTFKKRQKEQQRKDKQLAKMEKRLQRKQAKEGGVEPSSDVDENTADIEEAADGVESQHESAGV
jgi:hypothetical protein